jgi:hypothetical protein
MKGVKMFIKGLFHGTIILFFITTVSFSQGSYLEKGQSGFGIGAGFSSNKDVSGLLGSAGVSISGIFDLGLSVGRFSDEKKVGGYDISAIAIVPNITINIIKQNETTPISISLSASYERDIYSSEALDQLQWSMNGDYFAFGGALFGNINVTPTMYIQPSGSIEYITGSTKITDDYGNSISVDNTATVFGFGVKLVFNTTETTIFGIGPGVSISKDNTTFSAHASVIFILSN